MYCLHVGNSENCCPLGLRPSSLVIPTRLNTRISPWRKEATGSYENFFVYQAIRRHIKWKQSPGKVQVWQIPHVMQLSQRAAVKVFRLVLNFGKQVLNICLELKNNRLGINTLLFLGANVELRKATNSFVMSVRLSVDMEQLGSHWTDFHIWYLSIMRKSVQKIQVSLKSDKNNGHFTRRPTNIFDNISSVLLITRNVSDKSCRENKNIRLMFNKFFQKSCRFEMWKMVEPEGAQVTIRRMRTACWITSQNM